MKYDLIVVGGGPAGLTAARTAAEDGLKVLLIERKKEITKVNRLCSETIVIQPSGFSTLREPSDKHIEPTSLSVEIAADKNTFHYPQLGFSFDYGGPLHVYYDKVYLSPSGYQIRTYSRPNMIFGFGIDKEALLDGLLTSVEKAGAEVWAETTATGMENTRDGVRVVVRGRAGEQTLEARKAIAADGNHPSRMVESLGLNEKRRWIGPPGIPKVLMYIMEGVEYMMEGAEASLPQSFYLEITIPSINPYGPFTVAWWAGNLNQVLSIVMGGGLSLPTILDNFMKHPTYAPWFHHARLVNKMACTMSMLAPIAEPAVGNVVIVGDAAAIAETGLIEAIASGYQAVKAIEKELNGQKGNQEYIDWWQRSQYFNSPEHLETLGKIYHLSALCSDEDVDYIYRLFKDKVGMPSDMVADNLELIKEENPELYQKLTGEGPPAEVATEEITWTKEAQESLKKIPRFVRPMARKAVVKYAKEKGVSEITLDLMLEARKKMG